MTQVRFGEVFALSPQLDTREIIERALKGSLESSAREVMVALEMIEVAREESAAARDRYDEAVTNFEQERILCFLSEIGRKHRTWCSLHPYFKDPQRAFGYYMAETGGLTDGLVEISLIRINKSCFSRGDHYGSDHEWQEEHIHAVCPDCLEEARDHAGSHPFAAVNRVEKRDDGFYYKSGSEWRLVGDKARFFLAPQKLAPEWEAEFDIPPSLRK